MTTDLVSALKKIVGEPHVLTAADALEPYVTEWRGLWRGDCLCVVRPANAEDVAAVVRLCAANETPIYPQGGNTGLVGGGVPASAEGGSRRGIVLSTARLNRIRDVDALNGTLTAEAGCVLKTVQDAAADAGRLFPLSLAAEGSCTIGGNLSTNAGGVQVLRYGTAGDLVLGLEVVLADGSIWNGLKTLRKDNTGYDLKRLFLGAEGTLGVIAAATLKLFPKPQARRTAMVAAADAGAILELFIRLRENLADTLSAFEFADETIFAMACTHMPGVTDPFSAPHGGYALIEADTEDSGLTDVLEGALTDGVIEDAVIAESGAQADRLWHIRESFSEAQTHVGAKMAHDVSVPVSRVPEFIARARPACQEILAGVHVVAFGHLGDGNVHFNIVQSDGMALEQFDAHRAAVQERVHDLVHEMGGSFSAEHGVGLLKRQEMARYRPKIEIEMMRSLKRELDPENIMNPGKVLP